MGFSTTTFPARIRSSNGGTYAITDATIIYATQAGGSGRDSSHAFVAATRRASSRSCAAATHA